MDLLPHLYSRFWNPRVLPHYHSRRFPSLFVASRVFSPVIRLVTQGKEVKRAYKEAFEALAKAKAKMETSADHEDDLRKDMLNSFDNYCEAKVLN